MFKEIKLKGGVLDPQVEIDSIRALRREFGTNVPFRIDPNCAWSIDTSVHVGEALKEELSGGGYLEDPCAGLDAMSAVRKCLTDRGIRTPLASNVAVTSFPDVPRARDLDDMATFGGYANVQEAARQSVKGFRRYALYAVLPSPHLPYTMGECRHGPVQSAISGRSQKRYNDAVYPSWTDGCSRETAGH